MPWEKVCPVIDLPPGEARRLETVPPVAVFNVDGEFCAVDDTCTHADASLAEGYLDGDVVECPYHMARFCVRTGRVVSLPATRPLATHQTKVQDEFVYVEIGP